MMTRGIGRLQTSKREASEWKILARFWKVLPYRYIIGVALPRKLPRYFRLFDTLTFGGSLQKILLSTAAVLATVSFAHAADLPSRVYTKAPAAAPTYSWTGFYVGGGFGYGMVNEETSAATTAGFLANNGVNNAAKGWFGTVSAGYDYQFTDRIVAGVFGNYDFSDIKGTYSLANAVGILSPLGGEEKLSSTWAVGARLGWLFDEKTLTYVSGGYTQARFDAINITQLNGLPAFGIGVPVALGSRTLDGWFLGTGIETKLDFLPGDGWFARTEYRYARYDGATAQQLALGVIPFNARVTMRPDVQTVRTELTYKFNPFGAPKTYAAPVRSSASAPMSWTGIYISGGGGYGLANVAQSNFGFPAFPTHANMGAKGAFGIISGGVDYQFSNRIVAGVLANYDFANIHGTADTLFYRNPTDPIGAATKLSSSWAVGARAGWLITPKTLTYINGGYTEAKFDSSLAASLLTGLPAVPGDNVPGHTHKGWFLGSGVETKLDLLPGNGWFLRSEYRYAAYDSVNTVATLDGAPIVAMSFKPTVQTVRTELSYKFNWDGPVVAKY